MRRWLILAALLTACGTADPPPNTKLLTAVALPPVITEVPTPVAMPIPTEPIEPTATPEPTSIPQPTQTPIADTPIPTAEPDATEIPQPTAVPAPTQVPAETGPTFTNDRVDPPYYPCKQGQIKGNNNSSIFHAPDQRDYSKTYKNVTCFDTEDAALAAGFRKAQR
jgi:outer membrane biosynthesis protein TonB